MSFESLENAVESCPIRGRTVNRIGTIKCPKLCWVGQCSAHYALTVPRSIFKCSEEVALCYAAMHLFVSLSGKEAWSFLAAIIHGIMGRRFPDGGLLRYRKWVPKQLRDVNIQWSGDSQPMGARHGDTAANHTDLQSGCGQTCVFAVRVWSNLWDLIWLRTSHYSMIRPLTWWMSLLSSQGQF